MLFIVKSPLEDILPSTVSFSGGLFIPIPTFPVPPSRTICLLSVLDIKYKSWSKWWSNFNFDVRFVCCKSTKKLFVVSLTLNIGSAEFWIVIDVPSHSILPVFIISPLALMLFEAVIDPSKNDFPVIDKSPLALMSPEAVKSPSKKKSSVKLIPATSPPVDWKLFAYIVPDALILPEDVISPIT